MGGHPPRPWPFDKLRTTRGAVPLHPASPFLCNPSVVVAYPFMTASRTRPAWSGLPGGIESTGRSTPRPCHSISVW